MNIYKGIGSHMSLVMQFFSNFRDSKEMLSVKAGDENYFSAVILAFNIIKFDLTKHVVNIMFYSTYGAKMIYN